MHHARSLPLSLRVMLNAALGAIAFCCCSGWVWTICQVGWTSLASLALLLRLLAMSLNKVSVFTVSTCPSRVLLVAYRTCKSLTREMTGESEKNERGGASDRLA